MVQTYDESQQESRSVSTVMLVTVPITAAKDENLMTLSGAATKMNDSECVCVSKSRSFPVTEL